MPVQSTAHPDRAAATLAQLAASAQIEAPAADARVATGPGVVVGSGVVVGNDVAVGLGAADCRIDLKLLRWRAEAAANTNAAARQHLAAFPPHLHPDLWAGTVQDGTARGFAVRLEEAIALAGRPVAPPPLLLPPPAGARVTTGKELKKRKDVLIASAGARVRVTRKEGVLFVERDGGLHASNCLRFEACEDLGSLDAFAPRQDQRPRLFSAQFLQPQRLVESDTGTELVLAGRLGRGPVGWPCLLVLRGDPQRPAVQLTIRIDHRLPGWRLRARFLGLPLDAIAHECTPVHEVVQNDAGGFVAFTLVRASTRLLVGRDEVATPGAACTGPIVHTFWLGTQA